MKTCWKRGYNNNIKWASLALDEFYGMSSVECSL